MNLVEDIRTIQRLAGVADDGVFGPLSAKAVLRLLTGCAQPAAAPPENPPLDERTRKVIDSLDAKAFHPFTVFTLLAKATAATFGCDYVAIAGRRSFEEQADLRRKYLAGGPKAAPAGYSWHNYGIALDFGVFRNGGQTYCDEKDPALAERVHAACAVHAHSCGLEWGGEWKGRDCDPPHYQIDTGHSAPTAHDRETFQREGSVL